MNPDKNDTIISPSEQRHRLHGEEIPEVIEGLLLRRCQLTGKGLQAEPHGEAEEGDGRSDYPEPVTLSLIESWFNGTISGAENLWGAHEHGDEEEARRQLEEYLASLLLPGDRV